ncbi:hypothetical protein [Paraburkholderia phenoliruptrix]|uniref:hypothetical protein n=1 Tax=Paraburkholderia phenoliruptrix TaxID=252970 RepID=UPI001C6EE01A|nr:hypothetical protein [Paraburkholderia phenoliruptrix]
MNEGLRGIRCQRIIRKMSVAAIQSLGNDFSHQHTIFLLQERLLVAATHACRQDGHIPFCWGNGRCGYWRAISAALSSRGSRKAARIAVHQADDSVDAAILLFSGSANRTRASAQSDARMSIRSRGSGYAQARTFRLRVTSGLIDNA